MDIFSFLYVGVIGQITPIIWSIPFLFLAITKFRLFHITNTTEQTDILNNFKKIGFSSYFYDGKPSGFMIYWWFIAYIRYEESDWRAPKRHIMIFSTHNGLNFLKNNKKEDEDESLTKDSDESEEVRPQYLEPGINPYHVQWTKRALELDNLNPNSDQRMIVDEIISGYKRSPNKVYVVYLYGPKGTGKTSTGLFIAKEMNAFYTDNFNPTRPGFSLSQLYNHVNPTRDQPLIISMDEFNIMLENIHNETIREHKEIRIEILNKSGWNKMLDNLRFFYKNVIICLSSNKTPEEINSMDDSYIRAGRVNRIFEMRKPILNEEETRIDIFSR